MEGEQRRPGETGRIVEGESLEGFPFKGVRPPGSGFSGIIEEGYERHESF